MLSRRLYSFIWLFILPIALLRLVWRARKQSAYLEHIRERLSLYDHERYSSPTLWLHAVSVGETRAAEPLIRALLTQWPTHRIVLTHMTPTGRETAAALFAGERRIVQVYLPYDLPGLTARFLQHFRPELGIIMETELWPNLLFACSARKIPVVLANARLSARSAQRYARWPSLTQLTLGHLNTIGAQTEADALRFTALGAQRVHVTGNIKFDIQPPSTQKALGETFRLRMGNRPVLLAASTREGEEIPLLEAFTTQAPSDTLLVIVPRHPQRFNEVASLIHSRGLPLQRRSDETAIDHTTRVWLGDSMGEMFAYYSAADVALIGGGWEPLGGQNPIEACAVGTPAVVGPHMFNFEHITALACSAGAIRQEKELNVGIATCLSLLGDPERRSQMAASGRIFVSAHQGATQRTLALINPMHSLLP